MINNVKSKKSRYQKYTDLMPVGAGALFFIQMFSTSEQTHLKQRISNAQGLMLISALIFWTLYQLAPMGLTLFIERNVDRHLRRSRTIL